MSRFNSRKIALIGLKGEKGERGDRGIQGEKGDTGEVAKETIKEFINFFEFEEVVTEFTNGWYNCKTGAFTEPDNAYRSAKIPVSNGEIFSLTGGVYHNVSVFALVTYLDSDENVVGTEFNSVIGATSPALYNDEIIIIPSNVAYIAFTSRGQTPNIKKIKNKNILDYVEEIKKATSCTFDKYYELDLNSWDGVNVTPESKTYTAGSIWSLGKQVSTSATANYNALNEVIEVISGATYKLTDFCGTIDLTNAAHSTHKQINFISGVDDWELTIPDGYCEMGISISTTRITDFGEVIRLTPITNEEKQQLKIKIPKLSIEAGKKDFEGKKIVNFGDSIFGNTRPPQDISTKLAELTGATVYNCGFGGCQMSNHQRANFNPFSMCNLATAIANNDFAEQDAVIGDTGLPAYFTETLTLLKSIDFSTVDIITIAYGTNDFTTYDILEDTENLYDTNTFAGALRYSIETLLTAYPHLKIFICSQTYRFWQDDNGAFTEDSDTWTFWNRTLLAFIEKTEAIAKEYKLPYIDNYYSLGINKFNRTNYFPANDGTHHNQNGRDLIARHIAKELF